MSSIDKVLWTDWPIDHPLHWEVEKSGVELSLERMWGLGKGGFSFVFMSHYSTLLLIGNKLFMLPQVKSVLPVTVTGERSPCPHLKDMNLLFFLPPIIFSPPVLLRKGSDRTVWWSLASPETTDES